MNIGESIKGLAKFAALLIGLLVLILLIFKAVEWPQAGVGPNARIAIPEMIQLIESKGGAGAELKTAQFDQGLFAPWEMRQDALVTEENLRVHCVLGEGVCSGAGASIQIDPKGVVTVQRKTIAAVGVCKTSTSPLVHICIGPKEKASSVASECVNFCNGLT